MPCKPMPGTMQARLAASAKLSLTVASKTVPPPIAALGSKVQRCLGKQGAGHLRLIICHRVFYSAKPGQKISEIFTVFYVTLWPAPLSMLKLDMLFIPI